MRLPDSVEATSDKEGPTVSGLGEKPEWRVDRQINLLSVAIDDLSLTELLEDAFSYRYIFPVNVDVFLTLLENKELSRRIIDKRQQICLPMESRVLRFFAELLLGIRFRNVCPGADFFSMFCRSQVTNEQQTIFLLGGREGSASNLTAKNNLEARRQVVVGWACPEHGFENNPEACASIASQVERSGATCMVVGLGCPKQEMFILENQHLMPTVKLFIAVGAGMDFEAGLVKRAPLVIRGNGFEWLYRLCREPRRLWRRYLVRDVRLLFLMFILRFESMMRQIRKI